MSESNQTSAKPAQVAANNINTLVIDTAVRPIYPVRYAYANFFEETLQDPVNPPPLKDLMGQTIAAQHQGYVARLLRPGWVFIREEDGPGYFHIFKYEHIELNGQLEERFKKFLFRNGVNAQGGLKRDTSGRQTGYPFAFVSKEVTEVSILYTTHELNAEVIDRLNGSEQERSDSMQRVKLIGEDDATVEATASNIEQLVEDYREQKDRVLNFKESAEEPELEEIGLDILTTQASYELNSSVIANELRRKTEYGQVARIVGLFDPIGRQQDINEVHAKLVLWQKQYASDNLYPYSIGEIVNQLKQTDDEDLKELVEDSINWEEHDDYWQHMHRQHELFTERQAQFAHLFKAFMNDPALTGQVGSLDTYFKTFYCTELASDDERNLEVQKLCDTVTSLFNGMLSSPAGAQAIQELHSDFENEKNAYNAIFWETLTKLITSPQYHVDWLVTTATSVDGLFQGMHWFWAQAASWGEYEGRLATRASNKGRALANTYLIEKVLPKLMDLFGFRVTPDRKVTLTTEQIAKSLAKYMQEGINRYPAQNTSTALDSKTGQQQTFQKLFDWGQNTLKTKVARQWEAGQVEVTRNSPKVTRHLQGRFQVFVPENGLETFGMGADGVFAGVSAYFNLKFMWDLANQTRYDNANPLSRGDRYHDMMTLTSTITALMADTLVVNRAATGLAAASAEWLSKRQGQVLAQALAPKLAARANYLAAMLTSRLVSGLIAVANLAAAIDAFWNASISFKRGNYGEMVGYGMIGIGSAVLFGLAAKAVIAGAASGTVTAGIGVIIGTVVGLILLVAGVITVFVFGKSNFQVLLENCFWGNGKRYLFWDNDDERLPIRERLDESKRVLGDAVIGSAYQVEIQEFMNYFYQPKLEVEDDTPFFATVGDLRIYYYRFSLPNFEPGISELHCSVKTWPTGARARFGPAHNQTLTDKLRDTVNEWLESLEENGSLDPFQEESVMQMNLAFETDQRVQLHWHYEPRPGVIAPRRYLSEDGVIESPIQGMVDEDSA